MTDVLRLSEKQVWLLWAACFDVVRFTPHNGKFRCGEHVATRATADALRRQGLIEHVGDFGRDLLDYRITAKGRAVAGGLREAA